MKEKTSIWKVIGIVATIGGAVLGLIADEMERKRQDEEINQKIEERLSKEQS